MANVYINIFQCRYRFGHVNISIYQRHVLIVLLMLGMMNMYGMRYALNDVLAYIRPNRKNETLNKEYTVMALDWSDTELLVIRRCFSIGYVVGHLPAGVACDLYGGRSFLLSGIAISTLITFVTPSLILYSPWWGMIIRNVFLGLAQGMTMPSFYNLFSHWLPSVMLTAGSSIGYSGGTLGNLVDQIIARRFIEDFGKWAWVFYTWGIVSVTWLAIAACYVFSNPESHPFVSEKERDVLEEELGVVFPDRIPLKSILTDSGMWALLVGQFGHDWTLFICITSLRRYIRVTLQVDVSHNLVALYCRHLLYWANTCACGLLVNFIIRKELLPTHNVRALFAAIGIIAPSIAALILTYSGDDPNLIITLSILTLFLKGPINAGLKANIFDITRHYVGTIAGLTNGLGAMTSVISLDLINNMAPDDTVQQWRKVTWMSFAVCCYSYLVFFIWIKSSTAHWDFEKKTDRNLCFTDGKAAHTKRRSS